MKRNLVIVLVICLAGSLFLSGCSTADALKGNTESKSTHTLLTTSITTTVITSDVTGKSAATLQTTGVKRTSQAATPVTTLMRTEVTTTTRKATKAPDPDGIDFESTVIRVNYESDPETPVAVKITSYTDLQAYIQMNKSPYGYGDKFDSYVLKYTNSFFANKSLILVPIVATSGSFSYTVDAVSVKGAVGVIAITKNMPGLATCDMAYHYAFIEASKADLAGVESFSVNYTENRIRR